MSSTRIERVLRHDGIVAVLDMTAEQAQAGEPSWVGEERWKPIVLELKELAGQRLSDDVLRKAVQNVRTLAEPMPDVRGSAAYKREMAVEFSARALLTAWKRAQKQ